MANMTAYDRRRWPSVATFIDTALPKAFEDGAKKVPFLHWSSLTEDEARECLCSASSAPWIDIGDTGATLGGSPSRGKFDPNLPNRIMLAEDIAAQFAIDGNLASFQRLVEATVLHELVHWGCAKKGVIENVERGVQFEAEVYGGPQIRYGDLVNGRFAGATSDLAGTGAAVPEDLVERTIKGIVNVFETSLLLGDYSAVTLIPGDSGGLTYGRSQTTLNSDGLATLLKDYVESGGAFYKDALAPFLDRVRERDPSLAVNRYFTNLLRAAADDPIMRAGQDAFFDKVYWRPACRIAGDRGITTALGRAVVYDSTVHGSWNTIAKKTDALHGDLKGTGEKRWIEAYVDTRRQWLTSHPRKDLRATEYRMVAFKNLIALNRWDLALPFVVRGVEFSTEALYGSPERVYDGPQPGSRALELRTPLLRGLDVRRLQLAMSAPPRSRDVLADAIFGPGTEEEVRKLQREVNLESTGVVGDELFRELDVHTTTVVRTELSRRLEERIREGRITFQAKRFEAELLGTNTGGQIVPRLQSLLLAMVELVDGKIEISSIIREGSRGHHGAGRALDIGNEAIAKHLLPLLATDEMVAKLGVDELIFDASVVGESDRNLWNYDQGRSHAYNVATLEDHRDHIHLSVVA